MSIMHCHASVVDDACVSPVMLTAASPPRSRGDERGLRVQSPSLRSSQPARPKAELGLVPIALPVPPVDAATPEWRCVIARNERERREYAKISEARERPATCDGIGDDDEDNSLPADDDYSAVPCARVSAVGADDGNMLVMADLTRSSTQGIVVASDQNDYDDDVAPDICFCGALDFDAIWSGDAAASSGTSAPASPLADGEAVVDESSSGADLRAFVRIGVIGDGPLPGRRLHCRSLVPALHSLPRDDAVAAAARALDDDDGRDEIDEDEEEDDDFSKHFGLAAEA